MLTKIIAVKKKKSVNDISDTNNIISVQAIKEGIRVKFWLDKTLYT